MNPQDDLEEKLVEDDAWHWLSSEPLSWWCRQALGSEPNACRDAQLVVWNRIGRTIDRDAEIRAKQRQERIRKPCSAM